MDVITPVKEFSNVGLGVMIFIMWYYENRKRGEDSKKIDTLQLIINQQMDDKRVMREDRAQIMQLLESHAALIGRAMGVLDRME